LTLRPSTVAALDDLARRRGWARSQLADLALSGADRLRTLEAIADAELEAQHAAHTREKAPNATEVISESSASGQAALQALNRIAAGNRK